MRVPLAPLDITADRRGDRVDVSFTVPVSNTDNTRPANVTHMDVYAVTGAPNVSDEQMLKVGTKVGSVAVKSIKDPNAAVDPNDELAGPTEAPEGKGLDQGAPARLSEALTPDMRTFVDVTLTGKARSKPKPVVVDPDDGWPHPLFGAPVAPPQRVYAVIGYNNKEKKGPFSKRVLVSMVPPPPAPVAPVVTFTEKEIAVKWAPGSSASRVQAPASGGVLPARLVGMLAPTLSYNLYEVPPKGAVAPPVPAGAAPPETKLTKTSVTEPAYTDTRMAWGTERCYLVRAVETANGQPVESEATAPVCVKLIDTFPPAAPRGLTAVASEGAISLIWQANTEADLAGYVVYRGATEATLQPVMTGPTVDTTYRDGLAAGLHYVYAVVAVDKAGNRSPTSNRVEETAR